jgi:hypothetical protein
MEVEEEQDEAGNLSDLERANARGQKSIKLDSPVYNLFHVGSCLQKLCISMLTLAAAS